ncbi:MAG: hypothetical protein V3R91_10025 [Myxococcota bacterium]
MSSERFEQLAVELAGQVPDLPRQLADLREPAEGLRELANASVQAFVRRAGELGAEHLTRLAVSPVVPDEKHVDCLQFTLSRGRWELVCVAIAKGEGKIRLVGPFKQGESETPCLDLPLRGSEVESALEDGIESLIRQACVG